MIARLARVTVLLSAAVLVWVFVATAQSDPFVGTWRLNVAKSKYAPGRRRRASHPPMKQRARDTRSR